MVARYLASRRDVRRVVVVDAPISDARLAELASGDSIDQQRWIYERTLEKLRGSCDVDGVMHKVFVYPSVRFAPDSHERSDERRVGKECVSTFRSRWSPYH